MPAGITQFGVPSLPETPAEKDRRLLKEYRSAPIGPQKDRALSELLNNLTGAIMTGVNAFQTARLPRVTLELEGKRIAKQAIEDYDTTKGMTLASYVTTMVKQRLYRYAGTYQNVARIPEAKIRQIGPLREAQTDLMNRYGREPTTAEIADHMGVSVLRVAQLRRLLRKDLLEEGTNPESLEAFEHDPDYERAMLAYYSMTDNEKHVFDYSLGAHGQKQLSTNEIAKKLNVSAARVSQLKKAIADKIRPYLGGDL